MTTIEKAKRIEEYCDKHEMCSEDGWECPLWKGESECYMNCTDEEINHNYEVLFSSGQEAKSETVNHPQHYKRDDSMECIDEMLLVFDKETVKHFCLCNVWKYRYRAAEKNGMEDLRKSDWYMKKYKELCEDESDNW